MNKKQLRERLLKMLRKEGYKGEDDAKAVQDFCSAKALEIDLPDDMTVADLFADDGEETGEKNTKPAKGRVLAVKFETDEQDNGVAEEIQTLRRKVSRLETEADKKDATKASPVIEARVKLFQEPKWQRRQAERKRFDRASKAGRTVTKDYDLAVAYGSYFRSLMMAAEGQDYPAAKSDAEVLKAFGVSVEGKAQVAYDNSLGGFTFLDELNADIIDLKETYGAFRAGCGVTPMRNDTQVIPRVTGRLTVYSPGETGTLTASTMTFDQVGLNARKRAIMTQLSSEIIHDSEINIADLVMRTMAWNHANDEDLAGFTGDGTSTYFNVVGAVTKIQDVDGAGTDSIGVVSGSGSAWSAITYGDFCTTAGAIGLFPEVNQPAWFMSKNAWAQTALRVSIGLGGVTTTEFRGRQVPELLGYPVIFTQALPRSTATNTVFCLFGQLGVAAKFGEVSGASVMDTSDQRYWDQDMVAIRSLERIAITVHDVGSSTVYGPLAALKTTS